MATLVTVGDDPTAIINCVRDAQDRAEIFLVSGGLGPTVDDVTLSAVARGVGALV